eukprot:TRINITY_DN456_c0_g1_i3.p1 TRINITY_DN456_c0_g1~~TRINITY_DN456_c0_g1_i3.p1  ORF type:complete len:299 (+),score=41.08 TRINITY_DN456_c0_g1_i3:22-918(+)
MLPSKEQHFTAWAKANSLLIHNLHLSSIHGFGRGLLATNSIHVHDLLLEIPSHLIISKETAISHPIIGRILLNEQNDFVDETFAMVILLLYEKNSSSSRWGPYLKMLPSCYEGPLYWDDNEINLLQDQLLYYKVKRLVIELKSYYNQLLSPFLKKHHKLFGRNIPTFSDYLWASHTIWSRAFQLNTCVMIIPFADMLNMYVEDGTQSSVSEIVLDTTNNVCRFFSQREYSKDEQVFVDYGRKPNSEFLVFYGFLFENNVGNQFLLSFPSLPTPSSRQHTLLKEFNLPLECEITKDCVF